VADDLKDALAHVASGVVVVSARSAERYHGLTATSLVSVSVEPPMVLVSLEHETSTLAAVRDTRQFNVNALTRQQEFLAERFAGRAPAVDAHWHSIPHHLADTGVPLLDRCAAWLECAVTDFHTVGDHDICIARVTSATAGEGDPLILWDRSFWTLR